MRSIGAAVFSEKESARKEPDSLSGLGELRSKRGCPGVLEAFSRAFLLTFFAAYKC
jgi:hypothetical protein